MEQLSLFNFEDKQEEKPTVRKPSFKTDKELKNDLDTILQVCKEAVVDVKKNKNVTLEFVETRTECRPDHNDRTHFVKYNHDLNSENDFEAAKILANEHYFTFIIHSRLKTGTITTTGSNITKNTIEFYICVSDYYYD